MATRKIVQENKQEIELICNEFTRRIVVISQKDGIGIWNEDIIGLLLSGYIRINVQSINDRIDPKRTEIYDLIYNYFRFQTSSNGNIMVIVNKPFIINFGHSKDSKLWNPIDAIKDFKHGLVGHSADTHDIHLDQTIIINPRKYITNYNKNSLFKTVTKLSIKFNHLDCNYKSLVNNGFALQLGIISPNAIGIKNFQKSMKRGLDLDDIESTKSVYLYLAKFAIGSKMTTIRNTTAFYNCGKSQSLLDFELQSKHVGNKKNKNINNSLYMIKENDRINICVNKASNKLWFEKNGETMCELKRIPKDFSNHYFAICSKGCNCNNVNGFEFELRTFHTY